MQKKQTGFEIKVDYSVVTPHSFKMKKDLKLLMILT